MTPGRSLRAIARLLGGEACGQQVLCPGPNHGPKDRSLSIRLSATAAEGFVYHSFAGDDFRDCRDHVRERLGLTPAPRRRDPLPRAAAAGETQAEATVAPREAFVRAQIAAIVSRLVPVIGSPGEQYLRVVRRIDTTAIRDVLERTDAIGWHPAVLFNEPGHPLHRQLLGCIVGVMTDVRTAEVTGAISRTYLDAEGRKFCKAKTLGSPAGIVRLSEIADALGGLHLAEGLESGLTAMAHGFRPIWVTGGKSLLRTFPLLAGVQFLTVFADHDENGDGEKAAREVEKRWLQAGREARIRVWDGIGDINEALRAAADEP
jgi:putative DNA primase/helicase